MSIAINLLLRQTCSVSKEEIKKSLLRCRNQTVAYSHLHFYSTQPIICRQPKFSANKNPQSLLRLNNELVNCRSIKTTSPNRVPPVFWLILRPMLNVAAFLGGRRARAWWKGLSEEKKQHYRKLLIRNKRLIYSIVGGLLFSTTVYYFTHLEESPITKRKRFIGISKEKFNELANIQFEMQLKLFQDQLLPNRDPRSRQVERVATRIIKSNLDIPQFREKKWTTAVIDAPHIKNAMVVGDAQIFVFTGMLNICDNDDSLGFVLSHEIAHSILSHGIEMLSHTSFLSIFTTITAFILSSILPTDFLSIVATYLSNKMIDILFSLPFNREMEIEADKVGMLFAAKSCFDVREGVAFWMKMGHFENQKRSGFYDESISKEDAKKTEAIIEYLSTHPDHNKRSEYLESMLAESLDLRERCNCPRLPYRDPIQVLKHQIEAAKRNKALNYTIINF